MSLTRQEVLQRLNDQKAKRSPIVGCGAGTGISAKLAEAGGADLIIIYNSGRYRMAGRGSLAGLMPYGDDAHGEHVHVRGWIEMEPHVPNIRAENLHAHGAFLRFVIIIPQL